MKDRITRYVTTAKPIIRKHRRLLLFSACFAVVLFVALIITKQRLEAPGLSIFKNNTSTPASVAERYINPLSNVKLFVNPDSDAARQASQWQASRPQDAAAMGRLAALPIATWITSDKDLQKVPPIVSAAKQQSAAPLLVVYNIPYRDCGKYSAGGAKDLASYKTFIDSLTKEVGDNQAVFIVEPDAATNLGASNEKGKACLSDGQRTEYVGALRYAVAELKSLPNTTVYLDGGNSAWIKDTELMSELLREADVAKADGFSLNVSNFHANEETIAYGKQLSGNLDGKHFVVDTSRNGVGAYKNPTYKNFNWCNPPDRALGHFPTAETGVKYVDAYLYIKIPGQSDGQDSDPKKCFGGPAAGTWWPEYALNLIKNWPDEFQPRQ